MTPCDVGSSARDSPSGKEDANSARDAAPVDVVWTCTGAAIGFTLSATASQPAVASIVALVLLLVTLRSSLAGLSAILSAISFSVKVDLFGYWIYSLHVVVLVVFAALLLRIAKRSNWPREILATAGMLGTLALLYHLAKIERFHPGGFDVAFATQLAFLVLLPRFFYVLWRGTSRAFAWCSSAFFFLLAVATVATSSTAYSWSFLRYVELWGGAVIAAARLRADQARLLLWLFVLLAIGVAILGVAQHFGLTPAGPFPVGAYTRASATFGQPNPFGGFVAMAVAAAFGLLLRTRATEAKIACASLFLLSLGLFASLSRGAIAACIAALLVLSMFARRLDSSVATIGIGLALVLAGSVPFFWNGTLVARWSVPERATSVIQGTQAPAPDGPREADGIVQRWIGLRTAARMIGHQPWFGFGLSGYSEAMARHAAAGLDDTYYDNHIHNLYLQIWIESGVFVLAAFLAGLCVFLVQCVNGLNVAPVLVLPAVGIVVVSCTHNMFDILFVHGMQLLVGFALSAPIIARRKTKEHLHSGAKS